MKLNQIFCTFRSLSLTRI